MDLQAYISSGILEAYVLGDISAEQAAEVERMAQSHPEVKAELEAIEIALESYAMENAVNPSNDLFTAIEEKLPPKQQVEKPQTKESLGNDQIFHLLFHVHRLRSGAKKMGTLVERELGSSVGNVQELVALDVTQRFGL